MFLSNIFNKKPVQLGKLDHHGIMETHQLQD